MIVYFAGCMATYRLPEIARAAINILKHANVEFVHLGEEEWCCGSVLLRTGNREFVETLVEHNLDAIERADASQVVTSCAGCYRTLKKDYKDLSGPLGFEVVHLPELVDELVQDEKIELSGFDAEIKVTYHDPCHLGRHMGVYEPPRRSLKRINGLELIEMPRARENARCCGAGGGMMAASRELAETIGETRLREALSINANILTTACPFCTYTLRSAAGKAGASIKVQDYAELIWSTIETSKSSNLSARQRYL